MSKYTYGDIAKAIASASTTANRAALRSSLIVSNELSDDGYVPRSLLNGMECWNGLPDEAHKHFEELHKNDLPLGHDLRLGFTGSILTFSAWMPYCLDHDFRFHIRSRHPKLSEMKHWRNCEVHDQLLINIEYMYRSTEDVASRGGTIDGLMRQLRTSFHEHNIGNTSWFPGKTVEELIDLDPRIDFHGVRLHLSPDTSPEFIDWLLTKTLEYVARMWYRLTAPKYRRGAREIPGLE